MSKVKKKSNKNAQINDSNIFYILPLVFIIAVIPLIVYFKYYSLSGIEAQVLGSGIVTDVFNYYKMVWLLLATSIALIIFIFKLKTNKLEIIKSKLLIPIIIYSVLVIISTLISQYKEVALWGFFGRYEGMFVLLSYMLLVLITYNLINTERSLKVIIYSLVPSSVIILTIGLFQYFGLDFFNTSFGQSLIMSPSVRKMISSVDFTVGSHTVYSTLDNSNFVGSYVVLLLPIAIGLIICARKPLSRIFSSIFLVLLLFNTFGCNSRAGIVGSVFSLLFLLFFYRKQIIKHYKILIAVAAGFTILLAGINVISNGKVLSRIKSIIPNDAIAANTGIKIENILLQGSKMDIITNTAQIKLESSNNQIKYFDQGKLLDIIQNNDPTLRKITFKDPKYSNYEFDINNSTGAITAKIGGNQFEFCNTLDGFRMLANNGVPTTIEYPEKFGFNNQESLGSGRGFIWSRSIPLLKNTILIGHGPDTFPLYFPQNDFIGKLDAYNDSGTYVDKPHNFFLQIGINTGILSLAAILILFLMYFADGFKLFFRRKISSWLEITGVSILCSCIGYVFAGIFNDSVIDVAPVFWIIFGLGVAVNRLIRKQDEKPAGEAKNNNKLSKGNSTKKKLKTI